MKKKIIAVVLSSSLLLSGCIQITPGTTTTAGTTEAKNITTTTAAPTTTNTPIKLTVPATTTTTSTSNTNSGSDLPKGNVKTTYEGTIDKIFIRTEYFSEGDRLLMQRTINAFNYQTLGITTDEEKQNLKDRLKAASDSFQGIKGVKEKIFDDENGAYEAIEIDFTIADFKELNDKNVMRIENADKITGISLKRTIENITSQGLKLVPNKD